MKSVVIYYSLTGNTDLVAKMIAERIGADTIKIKPEKEIPTKGSSKFFLGGKSVIFHEKPKLLNENLSLEGYDTLIIGTPIWASSFTPPINTFLSENVIKDKNIYFFATHSPGTKTDKCFEKMKEKLSRNRIKGTTGFEDVKKTSAKELDDKVRKFCKIITE
ncbi:MAG TPA: flavodoxin [Anaerovoracaceae bacterium]|nr:flavodoxin [Anaerovoracaceae bacterium]